MGLDASILERQLARAEARLSSCVKALTEKGVEEAEWGRCPDWRHADADRRQAKRRLSAAKSLREPSAGQGAEGGSDEEE